MKQKAVLAVVIGAIMAGSSGVFIKYLSIPATSISFIRTAIPTVLMGMAILLTGGQLFRGNYKLMLGASALNAARMYCFFTAYIYTSIGNAVIITYTWPIFATLFSVLYLGETIRRRNVMLLLLAFTGIALVYANKSFSFEDHDFLGMTAALGAALFHAMAVMIFKKESDYYSRKEILFYQNLLGAVIFLPFILLNQPVPTGFDVAVAGSHAVLLGIIAFSFFFYGLKYLPASTTSGITYIEVVSALCFSVFWMREALTWNMMVGGAIILCATAWLRR